MSVIWRLHISHIALSIVNANALIIEKRNTTEEKQQILYLALLNTIVKLNMLHMEECQEVLGLDFLFYKMAKPVCEKSNLLPITRTMWKTKWKKTPNAIH